MKRVFLFTCFVVIVSLTDGQTSALDMFIGPFRKIKSFILHDFDRVINSKSHREDLRRSNRLQKIFPEEKHFPCNLTDSRSKSRPTSVHRLRPGDIDVIGALGDSLTAGFGLFAKTPLYVPTESRGASFSAGGDSTWREFITLPNILKMFNPNLIGYSTGNSLTIQKESQLNLAEGGAISDNTPYMAKMLVSRILNDNRIDVKNDWKLVTYFIGHNDFCSEICFLQNPRAAIEKHKKDVIKVLRTLRNYLPRTLVNFIPPINVFKLKNIIYKPNHCYVTHSFECPCVFGVYHQNNEKLYKSIISEWQQFDIEVANYPEFQRDDFAVSVQTFSVNASIPLGRDGQPNMTLLSADCFHFSQLGNAAVANSLWNNMLDPIEIKDKNIVDNLLEKFNCPTTAKPFFITNKNSNINYQ